MITKKHFEYFKEYIKKYRNLLGAVSFEIFAIYDPEDEECRAHWASNDDFSDRIIYIYLCNGWGGAAPTKKEMEKVVFHEILEIIICDAIEQTPERPTAQESATCRHKIVRTIENLIFSGKK